MIEGIKIAVTSYKDNEESADLAAQIGFFVAKERKNQVFFIVNPEYNLIEKMRGRIELNDVTFCEGEPELNTGFENDEKTRIYIYDLGRTNGPISMSDKYQKIYITIDNNETKIEQAKDKISSITDSNQLVTVLLKNPDNDAIRDYRTVAKSVFKIHDDEYSRCPYDVKEDLNTFSHKAGFSVPNPKDLYRFDELPIKGKEESVKKEKKTLFGKKKEKLEEKKDVLLSEQEKGEESIKEEPFAGSGDNFNIHNEDIQECDSVGEKPDNEPELKKSIYGSDDDDFEKEGIKEKLFGFANGMKERIDREKQVKKEKNREETKIQCSDRTDEKTSRMPQKPERINTDRKKEPDYAGKIQSLKDKSKFMYNIISVINLVLIAAIFITGINFANGFRNKCHTPVKAEEIVISKVPTTNEISGIEVKNYSGVAKNKKVAVIIGEDTFIRPYTESMKDLKKKTSVKTKRYAITVSFTDDPFIQSMFGELTFVHHSALGESMFSNEDYSEIIAYAKRYYTKKKYDFFKYKDKDSIQPGTAPVSMIQDLEEN